MIQGWISWSKIECHDPNRWTLYMMEIYEHQMIALYLFTIVNDTILLNKWNFSFMIYNEIFTESLRKDTHRRSMTCLISAQKASNTESAY